MDKYLDIYKPWGQFYEWLGGYLRAKHGWSALPTPFLTDLDVYQNCSFAVHGEGDITLGTILFKVEPLAAEHFRLTIRPSDHEQDDYEAVVDYVQELLEEINKWTRKKIGGNHKWAEEEEEEAREKYNRANTLINKGISVDIASSQAGISRATYYNYKNKFG